MRVSVLLVDDVAELRSVVRQALGRQGGFEVVAEAGSGAEAIEAAEQHQPDLVVLDFGLPDLAGREVLTAIQTVAPDAQVVVFTGSIGEEAPAVSRQVRGLVRKDQDVGYLVNLLSDLTGRHEYSASLALGPDHASVAVARRFIAERCLEWGCPELVEDAKLVLTELVTNALVHAGTRCAVRAQYAGGLLRVEVVDHGGGRPDPKDPGHFDDHGRGLLLVSALCAAWGVDGRPDGRKIVWAELSAPPVLSRTGGASRA